MPTANPLASWDATRQQQYRQQHPDEVVILHVLLDASGSMHEHTTDLRKSYNVYLRWFQRNGPPMALMDVRCFGSKVQPKNVQALGRMQPLGPETYSADYGGTALFDAVGQVVTQASEPGQHVLIIFTDGMDANSEQWTPEQINTLLSTLQTENHWLCVFLGAFPGALSVAKSLGFLEGNSLVFGTERIPEAFERLRRATESYLLATPTDRKLLAQSGVFHLQ